MSHGHTNFCLSRDEICGRHRRGQGKPQGCTAGPFGGIQTTSQQVESMGVYIYNYIHSLYHYISFIIQHISLLSLRFSSFFTFLGELLTLVPPSSKVLNPRIIDASTFAEIPPAPNRWPGTGEDPGTTLPVLFRGTFVKGSWPSNMIKLLRVKQCHVYHPPVITIGGIWWYNPVPDGWFMMVLPTKNCTGYIAEQLLCQQLVPERGFTLHPLVVSLFAVENPLLFYR